MRIREAFSGSSASSPATRERIMSCRDLLLKSENHAAHAVHGGARNRNEKSTDRRSSILLQTATISPTQVLIGHTVERSDGPPRLVISAYAKFLNGAAFAASQQHSTTTSHPYQASRPRAGRAMPGPASASSRTARCSASCLSNIALAAALRLALNSVRLSPHH